MPEDNMCRDHDASLGAAPVRTTRAVQVIDISPGDPRGLLPSLLVAEALRTPGGKKRSFTQDIPVTDNVLFLRLLAEVRKGDQIEVEVVTEFSGQGYASRLVGFRRFAQEP